MKRYLLTTLLVVLFSVPGRCLPDPGLADNVLKSWRDQVQVTRTLAENDIPRAYQEAQHLQATLPANATPVDRVRILNLLARTEIYSALTAQAAKHCALALDLARKNGDKIGRAEADLNITLNSVNEAKVDALVVAATDSLDALHGVDRPALLNEALLRTAAMYLRTGQFDEAVTMTLQAMEIARESKNPLALAYAHQGLAITNAQNGRFTEARAHYEKMLDQARAANSKILENEAMLGLGDVFTELGDYNRGESLIRAAIKRYQKIGGPFFLAHALVVLSGNLRHQGRYAEAIPVLDKVVSIYEQHPNKIGLWWTLMARSEVNQTLGHFVEAKADAERANALSIKIGFALYRIKSERRMAALAAAHGDYQKAYQYFVEADTLESKAAIQKASDRMVEVAQRYQTEIKQLKINQLTRINQQQSLWQRWLWTLLGAGLLLLLITGYFLIRQRYSNRSLETVNMQLQRWHHIFEHAEWGVVVGSADGRTLELMNPAFAQMHGYTVEELMGQPIAKVFAPASRESISEQIQLAHSLGHHSFESWHLHKDGSIFPVLVDVTVVHGENGEILHRIVNVQDISMRKEAESILAAREQEFRTLAENLPDSVVRFNTSGQAVYVNPSFVKFVAKFVVNESGTTLTRFISETQPDIGAAYCNPPVLERVLTTGEPEQIETTITDPSGKMRIHLVSFVVEQSPNLEKGGVLAIGRDITEIRIAERQLEQSRSQLREMTAQREQSLEEERKRIAREIHDELGQVLLALKLGISTFDLQFGEDNPALLDQVQDLLGLADRSIQVVREVAYSLRPAAMEMGIIAALQWLGEEFERYSGLTCYLQLPSESPALSEDLTMVIFRAAQESLTNVGRYAEATRVDVTLECSKGSCQLEVRDNGKGFDPSAIDKKSFGLLGMRERVIHLSGEVEIISAPAQGTSVRVYIPRHGEDQSV